VGLSNIKLTLGPDLHPHNQKQDLHLDSIKVKSWIGSASALNKFQYQNPHQMKIVIPLPKCTLSMFVSVRTEGTVFLFLIDLKKSLCFQKQKWVVG
jgi:hypothetical protein